MKKTIALILAAILTLSLAACGNADTDSGSTKGTVTIIHSAPITEDAADDRLSMGLPSLPEFIVEEIEMDFPHDADSEENVPEEGVREESVPEESVPEESVPEESVPEEDAVEEEDVTEEDVVEDSVDDVEENASQQPEQPEEAPVETPTETPATEATEAPTTTAKPTTTTTKKPTTTTTKKTTTTTTQKPTTTTTKKPTTTTTTKPTTTTTKKPTTTTTTKPTTTTTAKPTTTTTAKPTTTTTQKPTTTTTTTTPKPTNPTYDYTTNQKHVAVPYTQRYHYNQLDDSLKEIYALVVKAVENLEAKTEKFVVDDAHEETFRDAYLAFFQDHPEHFYLARYYGVCNYGSNKQFYLLYSVAAYDVDPTGSNQLFDEELSVELKQRILDKKATFDAEVQKIISTIPVNAPDVVKEQMAYQTILKACRYNMQAVNDYLWDGRCEDNWTAYGIMVNKKGVCESYSEAFQTLCLQMGINCITVSGTTAGGGHMWNVVQLDDGWYMCDITFDDPIGSEAGTARYNYFNRTSQWMQDASHTWQFSNDFTIPKCTKTTYSYEEYFGRGVLDDYWEESEYL